MSRSVFLPDRLRPAASRRRPRGRLALVAMLPACLLLLPLWRVQAVNLTGCPGLPTAVEQSLRDLEGASPLTIDLERIREQVEVWPAVDSVEVHFELPGTVYVTARPATARASVPVGSGWHGVDRSGRLTGALSGPLAPSLEGFRPQAEDLLRGLAVADRLSRATKAEVLAVRRITPSDLELTLDLDGRPAVVHVTPRPTAAERLWCARAAAGELIWRWADLRWDSRLVLGRAEPSPPAEAHAEHGGLS